MADLTMIFGHALRHFRKLRELSQKDLEKKSGFKSTYISSLELGEINPTLKTVQDLAAALEIEAWELLIDVGAESRPTSSYESALAALKDEQETCRRVLVDNWKMREKIGDLTDAFFSSYQHAAPEHRSVGLKIAQAIFQSKANPSIPANLLAVVEKAEPGLILKMIEAALQLVKPGVVEEALKIADQALNRPTTSKGRAKA